MKKQIAITSAILAATSYSFAEIALTESLSVEGFVDMSYSDSDAGDSAFGIDQVEFDFLFNAGGVSAQVDVEYEEAGAGTNIEQAFVTYDLGNGGSLSVGRMASSLGFEAFEPTGLYQYSYAYTASPLPGYNQGVKYSNGALGVAIVDGVAGGTIGDGDGYTLEVAYSAELGEGLNGFIGAALNQPSTGDDTQVINAYVTYETGAWLFAGEIVDSDIGGDATDYLIMANYTLNDSDSVTVRYSDEEGVGTGVTVAYLTALADNLALVAEVSKASPDAGEDITQTAVELLFTF